MDDEILRQKNELRKRMRLVRQAFPAEDRRKESEAICDQALRSDFFQRAKVVMCYASMPDEAQTGALMRGALALGKRLCVPYIGKEAGLMEAAAIGSMDDLVPGKYGIWTAKDARLSAVDPARIDLILAPGLAFDTAGRRLGMGGGFYDRFLRRADCAVVMGLALTCQIVSRIPFMPHDQKVDFIATARGVIHCKTGKM